MKAAQIEAKKTPRCTGLKQKMEKEIIITVKQKNATPKQTETIKSLKTFAKKERMLCSDKKRNSFYGYPFIFL